MCSSTFYFSGEEENYRAKELNSHGPTVKGWQSARHCSFPQALVLQLHHTATINKIQILAHQFLIPEKIEFFVGNVPPGEDISHNNAQFSYLGFIRLSDNESTGFKARELKSVTVSCTGSFLKLVLHKNHSNALNTNNQVGLVALNLLGQEVEDNNNTDHDDNATSNNLALLVSNPQYTSPYDDLAFEMYVDPEVAQIIRKMEVKKQEAVIGERFEYARKLKLAMEDLRKAGERLGKYELEKRQAIEMEDYDKAKLKKAQMDEYRVQVYQFLEVTDLMELKGPLMKNDESVDVNKRKELPPPPRIKAKPRSPSPQPPPVATSNVSPLSSPGQQQQQQQQNGIRPNHSKKRKGKSSYEAYDERMLPALRHQRADELLRDFQDAEDGGSRLSEREKKQATLPIAVFGTAIVEKFYSKQYADKEDGLKMLTEELKNMPSVEPEHQRHSGNKVARATVFLLHRTLKDKVFAVYSLAAEVIRAFFAEFVPSRGVSSAEVSRCVDRLLPELLAKSGDNTPRVHNMAVQTILSMAECQEVRDLHVIPSSITKPLTNTTHPRLALSRVEMVEQLIMKQGISTEKPSGMTCRVLGEFGSSGLHHPSEPVRKVSERILVEVYKVNPRLVRKQLPPDDDITRRNLLYRHLFQEFDRLDIKRKKEILEKNKLANRKHGSCKSGGGTPSPAHTTSSSTSTSVLTSPSDQGDNSNQDGLEDKMCIFCLTKDSSFTEEGLNVHYWKSCPMLTRCTHCKQVVEVASLTHHLLAECDARSQYTKCSKCMEAVSLDSYNDHLKSLACVPAETSSTANHCPLCHQNVPPWEEGWRKHLMGPRPCASHPRKKHLKSSSKGQSESSEVVPKPVSSAGMNSTSLQAAY